MDKRVLFLTKKNDQRCARALAFCRDRFEHVTACAGDWCEPLPEAAHDWEGDIVISYCSRWIVPAEVLERAGMLAINFHPGSPEYPGIGCINFALYDRVSEFGVTCHEMLASVDTGEIRAVKRFPVLPEDTVASLLERTHDALADLYLDVVGAIAAGDDLPTNDEKWTRAPYTRAQLDALATVDCSMDRDEIARRVRATTFGDWRPVAVVAGFRFALVRDGDD